MRIAPTILEDLRRAAKRPRRIDHPGRRLDLGDQRTKARRLGKGGGPGGEGQIEVGKRLFERHELIRAEDDREYGSTRGTDPNAASSAQAQYRH